MGTVRWYGDTSRGAQYFEGTSGATSHTAQQLDAVKRRIKELALERDGNGDFVVRLVAEPSVPVQDDYIAYRFTSDWAKRKYTGELVRLGGSLGRGVWDPFGDSVSTSHHLMMQKEFAPEAV